MFRKKIIYLAILLMMFYGCMTSRPTGKAFVFATKMNILYRAVSNPIEIYRPSASNKKLFVTVSDGKIYGSRDHYTIIPGRASEVVVTVKTLAHQDTVKIGEMKFKVRPLPRPYATLCYEGKTVEKEAFLKCNRLTLYFKGFDFKVPYKVTEFELSILHNDCIVNRLVSKNAYLTAEMKLAIGEAMQGDIIGFEKIKAISTDGKTMKVIDPNTNEEIDTGLPWEPMDILDFKVILE